MHKPLGTSVVWIWKGRSNKVINKELLFKNIFSNSVMDEGNQIWAKGMVETAFPSIRRMLGGHASASKFQNIVNHDYERYRCITCLQDWPN